MILDLRTDKRRPLDPFLKVVGTFLLQVQAPASLIPLLDWSLDCNHGRPCGRNEPVSTERKNHPPYALDQEVIASQLAGEYGHDCRSDIWRSTTTRP